MTQRTVVLAPGEPRLFAWLFHQQMYWGRCRWWGHKVGASDHFCIRCGTRLKEYEISDESIQALMDQTPPDLQRIMMKLMRPDTLTVGRP